MRKKMIVSLLALLLAVGLVLAACAPTPTPPTPVPPTPAPPAPVVGAPKHGGILRMFTNTDPAYFDPHFGRQATVWMPPVASIWNNLTRYDPEDPSKIIPDLAERWEISPDGLEATFYLRQGVKWHDGQPFTAEDVKFSLERMADPARAAAIAGLFVKFDHAEVIDDYTVKAIFSEPSASFFSTLATGYCVMQAKHIADEYPRTDVRRLVGTGPFKFKEYTPGVMFSVERNADYWEEGLPYLDGIECYIIRTEEGRFSALVGGEVDTGPPSMGLLDWTTSDKLRAYPDIVQEYGPLPNVRILWPGASGPAKPLRDIRVRRALSLVLQREFLILAYTGSSEWGAACGYFPLGTPGSLPEEEQEWMGLNLPYADRVAEAKALMQEAGYPDGFKAVLMVDEHAGHIRLGELAADLAKRHLNIDLTVQPTEEAVKGDLLLKKEFDLTVETATGVSGDPSDYLAQFFITGAPLNYSGYSNPKVDELFLKQEAEMDPVKRKELVHEIARILMDDMPAIPLIQVQSGVAYWNYVKGLHYPARVIGNWSFARVWLDK